MKFLKIISIAVCLGFVGCAGKVDFRHSQFENIYSQPLNAQEMDGLNYFIGTQVTELKGVLVDNLKDYNVSVDVEVEQIMLLDGQDMGSVLLKVDVNKKTVSMVSLCIIKKMNEWVVTKVMPRDTMPDVKAYIKSLPKKN